MILRLILGDQLNHQHTRNQDANDEVCYFMAEMRQETDYVKHHIQKVVAFFLSMRNFSVWLKNEGVNITYYTLDDPNNQQDLVSNLNDLIQKKGITKFEYQLPDEYRLDMQLRAFCNQLAIQTEAFDTEHFLTSRTDLTTFFEGKKQYIIEYFYSYMRKRYDIMMFDTKTPE